MMTKKHFDAIAKAVNDEQTRQHSSLATLAGELADICKADNPNFDRIRFIHACFGNVITETKE